MSDKSNDLLKYQWKLEDGKAKYLLDDNFQKLKTGFGKEIDYMENLVQQGKYQWMLRVVFINILETKPR